jgi:hypothetical protein
MSLEYTLPAAPPPAESEDTVRLAALHRDGPADDGGVADDDDDGVLAASLPAGVDVAGAALDVEAPAEVPWGCGWLGPQAVSRKAAAATAVVMASPFLNG